MKTTFILDDFSVEQEIAAVKDYISNTWDGLSNEEIGQIVSITFEASWEENCVRHSGASVKGKRLQPLSMVLTREELLERQGVDYLDYRGDHMNYVLRVLGTMDRIVYDRPDSNPVSDMLVTLTAKLGPHITLAAPKPQVSDGASIRLAKDFAGHYYQTHSSYHLLHQLSIDNVNYQIEEQNSNALYELIKGVYNHARDLRTMYNEEILGRTLKTLNLTAPLLNGETLVQVPYDVFTYRALTIASERDDEAARAFKVIDWTNKPQFEIADTPYFQ